MGIHRVGFLYLLGREVVLYTSALVVGRPQGSVLFPRLCLVHTRTGNASWDCQCLPVTTVGKAVGGIGVTAGLYLELCLLATVVWAGHSSSCM